MAGPVVVARLDMRELKRIIAKEPIKAAQIIAETAHVVVGEAQKRAPVDTGALKNSLNAEQKNQHLWWVQDGVEYGIYQELGFHHWRSGAFIQNPFLVPAVEFVRPHFNNRWRELF